MLQKPRRCKKLSGRGCFYDRPPPGVFAPPAAPCHSREKPALSEAKWAEIQMFIWEFSFQKGGLGLLLFRI